MDLLLNSGVIGRFHGGLDGPLVDWSNRVDFFRDIGGALHGRIAKELATHHIGGEHHGTGELGRIGGSQQLEG